MIEIKWENEVVESEGNKPQYDRESFSVLTTFKQAKITRKIKPTRQAGLVTDGPCTLWIRHPCRLFVGMGVDLVKG